MAVIPDAAFTAALELASRTLLDEHAPDDCRAAAESFLTSVHRLPMVLEVEEIDEPLPLEE